VPVGDGEQTASGASGSLPEDLRVLTLGLALGEPLEPVARLVTERRTIVLRDERGREAATIDDDDVAVMRGKRVAARFRELELRAGSKPQLERVAAKLRDVGAQPVDHVPKLVRALGPAAVAPDLETDRETAAGAVGARLARSLGRWSEGHAELVLTGSPQSVRAVRSGARGLRRELRPFAPAEDVRKQLAWLVDALAPVHRLDQLLARVEPGEGEEGVRAQLVAERAMEAAAAQALVRDARYAALLRDAARLVEKPPLAAKAARAPEEVLPRLVRDPLRRARRASPDDLEKLRRLVDRLYVAARAAAPYAGPDARRAVGQLADLRALLREHHRAEASVETLRRLAERNGENAWEAGLLAGAQRALANDARAAIADALERAMRPKLWSWVP
jgi:hypothetical protein